jgi:hypothetical protein
MKQDSKGKRKHALFAYFPAAALRHSILGSSAFGLWDLSQWPSGGSLRFGLGLEAAPFVLPGSEFTNFLD